ncbi:hypothetical protein QR680_000075 [Steinernema hermaphroditum]|uniref:J domain-containing protein n=1 Tax=Steinernema hermaphroditum TaxID=289476 RepID=A0AA39GU29_9BILA|nr:hypothetical protein QR680_000075 [Steinernema hermaphroditum]
MDNQFAASSALDDNERHYIGNLLSDDDPFTCTFNSKKEKVKPIHNSSANTNLPGPFQQIGPSPNGNFWPEPPPPYSAAVGTNSFSHANETFHVMKPLSSSSFSGSPHNDTTFYAEKSNDPFANAWPEHDQGMFSDYYNSTIFEGFGLAALEQNYEPFAIKDSLTVKVDNDTDSNMWTLSKDSSPLEQSPKASNCEEEERTADNMCSLARLDEEVSKPISQKLAEIETHLPTAKTCDNSAFCPPAVNHAVPKQSYSDVVINRSGEVKIVPTPSPQPKPWPKQQQQLRDKRNSKTGSVDRITNNRSKGQNANKSNTDFRRIIRKKGFRPQPTTSSPAANSTTSSNNHSPAKKRSDVSAVIATEPLCADRREISAGVVVHAPALKVDSSSRFEVLQSLPPSPTKKTCDAEKIEDIELKKESNEKRPSTDITPSKNNEKTKRRGLHHKLFGTVSQSRSASKKPIPVTAVGTMNSTTSVTASKKPQTQQLSRGIIRVTFNVVLALLTVAVEFLFHQLTNVFFAIFFAIQRGSHFTMQQVYNVYGMMGQLLSFISSYTQHVLRRMHVATEERLALFLAKEPSPSLQDLDDHFFLECNGTVYSTNHPLPRDAESLLERLYKCFYADPYVVLGLSRNCTDEDIVHYYNTQAALVDPGKITMHACAQAYDLLTYAYAAIGTPEERESYDKWAYPSDDHSESTESNNFDKYSLWRTWCVFRSAMDQMLRTLHCDCARYCKKCECLHPARQNDIWAESKWLGIHKCYYACLEGNIYDVSQWAACSCTRLKNLKSNNHHIHYRLQGTSGYSGLFQKNTKNKSKSAQNRNTLSLYENDLIEELVNSEISGDAVSVFPDRSIYERPRRAGRRRRFR